MSLLRAGIDASSLAAAKPSTGVQRYLGSLVTHLAATCDDLHLFLYFSIPVSEEVRAQGTVLSRVLPNSHITWRVAPMARGWNRVGMGMAMRVDQLDLFHFPAPLMAGYCPVPAVVTIHDLAALSIEADQTQKERGYLETALEAGRRAAGLIAVSNSTREEISRYLGREDVTVVPEGVDLERFHTNPQYDETVKRKYNLNRYILCAGTVQTRKNHIRLIQSFERIAEQIPHDLVIAGADGSGAEALRQYLQEHPNSRIRWLGYVDEAELPALYAGADVLALPSLWEGFGLPLLEAMACGTPVVTSNMSALAEVAGDAAVLVNPREVESIADGLLRVLTDELLRHQLIEAGQRRVEQFSWDAAAQRTRAVYQEVVAQKKAKAKLSSN